MIRGVLLLFVLAACGGEPSVPAPCDPSNLYCCVNGPTPLLWRLPNGDLACCDSRDPSCAATGPVVAP